MNARQYIFVAFLILLNGGLASYALMVKSLPAVTMVAYSIISLICLPLAIWVMWLAYEEILNS